MLDRSDYPPPPLTSLCRQVPEKGTGYDIVCGFDSVVFYQSRGCQDSWKYNLLVALNRGFYILSGFVSQNYSTFIILCL